MGLVLDFGATVLDGSVTLPVAFSGGTSGVLSFVARADAPGTGRTAHNPLRVYSDRIRVGTSEAACLEAEWGASLDDVGLVDDTGVTLYIQFRRLPGDGSVALTDSLGMVSTGFVVLTNTARGVSVSYGTGSAAQLAPASAHGCSVSSGAAAAGAVVPPAIGGGVSVSYGSAAAVQIAPAVAHGVSVSIGLVLGAQLAPASAHGTSISKGVAAGEASSGSSSLTGTYYLTNTDRSGDFAGDKQLVTPKPETSTYGFGLVAEGDFYFEGRLDISYALYRLDASGNVLATIKDWTAVGFIDNYSNRSNGTLLTVTGQSFADPAIGANEFFALRLRGVFNTNEGTGYTPYFTLAKGVNPGAQSGMSVTATGGVDEMSAYLEWGTRNVAGFPSMAHITFAGA